MMVSERFTLSELCRSLPFLEKLRRPLIVVVDKERRMIQAEGDFSYYGLFHPSNIEDINDWLPALIGLRWEDEPAIDYLNLDNGVAVDLNVFVQSEHYVILITDASNHHKEHQVLQQARNEVVMLNSQLQLLRLELEHKNHRLELANNTKSRFIAAMSHEFRTPILGMLGNLEKLRETLPADIYTTTGKPLQTLESNAGYLLDLVENLLQQQVIDADSLQRHISDVAIAQILSQIENTLRPLIECGSVSFVCELISSQNLTLETDESHLKRILFNVIGNAIKFTEVGEVHVVMTYEAGRLKVSVKDTGIGIPEDDLSALYTPFKRANNAKSKPGTGLGLANAAKIIQVMGGEIEISSELNVGTEVQISIPAKISENANNFPAEVKRIKPENSHALLVEDNEDLIDLYSYFFESSDVNLAIARNSHEALDFLETNNPKLIYVDYLLGDELGMDLAVKIREKGFSGQLVMLTASLDIDDNLKSMAIAIGCNDFKQKPSNVHELVSHARKILSIVH